MIKNNKWKLIISSLVILLPMIAGLIFWNELPELMPTHWGIDGNVDGMGGRGFVVFGIPLIMLALHWLCIIITDRDPGNKHQSGKVFGILYWITTAVTLLVTGIMYLVASGREVNAAPFLCGVLGINLLVIGNYMPKYRRNYTMGIKIKWTLESEENWNATHRMAGKLWVICGLILLACIPLPEEMIIGVGLAVLIVMIAVPFIYSWNYHRKQIATGFTPDKPVVEMKKWQKLLIGAIVIAILAFCVIICFTGNISVVFDENAFNVKATYYADITVEYDAIESIEYRDDFDIGTRISGFGTPRLSCGTFKNDEFGHYTVYAYNFCDKTVVMEVNGMILVINGHDDAETQKIYEEIISK